MFKEIKVTRKSFIKGSCGLVLCPAILNVLSGCGDSSSSETGTQKGGSSSTVTLKMSDYRNLEEVGGADTVTSGTNVPEEGLFVYRQSESKIIAMKPICTHKKGTLFRDGKTLHCPVHNSKFNLDGTVANPEVAEAKRALPTYQGTISGNIISISM